MQPKCEEKRNFRTNKVPALHDQFYQLSTLLQANAGLWRPVPFYLITLPWESDHPELARALATLGNERLAALDDDGEALAHWLAAYLPAMAGMTSLVAVPALPAHRGGYPSSFERDIPGRKWQQVTAFAGSLDHLDGPVLEWCAGKAHLARALNQRFHVPVTALEWNASLCREGNALGERYGQAVRLEQCDVLSPAAAEHAQLARHAVALHACGELHRRLIETTTAHGLHSLDLSPCCYHLEAGSSYKPFSRAGRASGLALSLDDCRLAVQETVTAAAVTTQLRQRKSAWRLGFDALQRELRGANDYLPVPSIPDAVFRGDFASFCRHAAGLKALALPAGINWPRFEQRGWERQARVSRMELPRHAFRRALELWLVLDRALYLEECGYRVAVGTFCERRVTPRNLMIRATRRPFRSAKMQDACLTTPTEYHAT